MIKPGDRVKSIKGCQRLFAHGDVGIVISEDGFEAIVQWDASPTVKPPGKWPVYLHRVVVIEELGSLSQVALQAESLVQEY